MCPDLLDLVPKGRDENDGPYKMDWVRHHDQYPKTVPAAGVDVHRARPRLGSSRPDPAEVDLADGKLRSWNLQPEQAGP